MVEFDIFTNAFLNKITSFDYAKMEEDDFNEQADLFMLAVCAEFDRIFRVRLGLTFADRDTEKRVFNWDFPTYEEQTTQGRARGDYISLDEVVDIISEGMVLKWMKSYLYSGDTLGAGNLLQTRDYTVHSPSSFLSAMNNIYKTTEERYKQLIFDFSYNHANLRSLHM